MLGSYTDPHTFRFPRTQSRVMAALEWEPSEGCPRPLWKDIAAGAGTILFVVCAIFALLVL